MPAYKARNKSKKAINEAVGKNMRELYKANQLKGRNRSRDQMIAIAESEARGGKKRKSKKK